MSEVLSQAEIDALLGALEEHGENAVEEIVNNGKKKGDFRDYDFNRPDKFNVDNLRSIHSISSVLAKNIGQGFTGRLRTPVQIEIASIEQIPFSPEYTNLPKMQYAFCVIDMGNPDLNDIVIDFDLSFLLRVHDRWLGGSLNRKKTTKEETARALTEFEHITLGKIMASIIFPNLIEAFESVVPIQPKFAAYETDPQFLKVTSTTDMIALITFNLSYDDIKSTIRLCIPFESVEEVIDKLTTENVRKQKVNRKDGDFQKNVKNGLKEVKETMKVSIGKTKITFKELMDLDVGDVLRLDKRIQNKAEVYVGNIHKFDAVLGQIGSKRTVQIADVIEDDNRIEGEIENGK